MQEILTILVVIYSIHVLVNVFRDGKCGCNDCNCGDK